MSFTFNWPRFSDQFHYDAIQMLNTALNKGNKPPIIADRIEVVELEMGTQPPELEIRDIGDLTVDQFRGIFRLTYSGDAHLVLKTKVQANPLNHKQPDIHLMGGSHGMLAAKQPLVVPMLLRLSHFKLNSYVVLVVSKQKGITLVFKTDPLQNVDINSTFDSIAVIQKFIQREIEGQLRQMFREDLPGIIHRLSQQWVKAKVEAPYLQKRPPPPASRQTAPPSVKSFHSMGPTHPGPQPFLPRQPSLRSLRHPRSVSGYSATTSHSHPKPKPTPPPTSAPPSDPVSFPDLENFDPTYGLRPEGLPTKSVFRGFSNLFTPNKGLADLTEEPSDMEDDDDDDDGAASFDMVNWDYTVPDSDATPPPSVYSDDEDDLSHRPRSHRHHHYAESAAPEYETIPAVGGGTITRPRIYHSQSLIQPIASSSSSVPPLSHHHRRPPSFAGTLGLASSRSAFGTPGVLSRPSSAMYNNYNPYFGDFPPSASAAAAAAPHRPVTPDSLETQLSRSSSGHGRRSASTPPTDPPPPHEYSYDGGANGGEDLGSDDGDGDRASSAAIYMRRPPSDHRRRLSVSSTASSAFSPHHHHPNGHPTSPSSSFTHDPTGGGGALGHGHPGAGGGGGGLKNPKIVLRPSLNNSIHQLSTLSHSNHTLSPYTRSLEHFTVRSVPPRGVGVGAGAGFGGGGAGGGGVVLQPVKARRKRTYRLGGRGGATGVGGRGQGQGQGLGLGQGSGQAGHVRSKLRRRVPATLDLDGRPPSEFDESDMDRYFRSHDESAPQSPFVAPSAFASADPVPVPPPPAAAATIATAATTNRTDNFTTTTTTTTATATTATNFTRPTHLQHLHKHHNNHTA